MDKNEFFREATLHICGNLLLEDAMYSIFQFLQKKMPVDRMYLQLFEASLNSMRTIAATTKTGSKLLDILTPLSIEAREEMKRYEKQYRGEKSSYVWLLRENLDQTMTKEMYGTFRGKPTSLLVLPLMAVANKVVGGGSLVLSTEGSDKFTQQHADLLSFIREPFSIAMSNALKHRNELRLFDRDFFFEMTGRICGNLEIEEGLHACIRYISRFMPADRLYLQRYQSNLNSMHFIARAEKSHFEKMNKFVLFNEAAKNKMMEMTKVYRAGKLPPVLVINNPEEEPVTKNMLEILNEPMSSALSLPLILKDRVIGTLVLLAEGNDRYEEQHAKLFATLKLPFFVALSNALKHREVIKLKELIADDNQYLQGELRRISGDEIVGADFGLKEVMHKVKQVAPLDSPVLLLGETGTGKDVIANKIHYASSRSDGPFVSVNCGAIPDSLIDSELFGHEKGAFTGALSQKRGRFERANKGTIFLDEIGELPLQAQVRLLKVLQSKEIERVGGTETIKLNIRVIAATNRNLQSMVYEKQFREDLWFRLNVFPIWIPPLRQRKFDIPALLQHFIVKKTKELNLPGIPELAKGAIDTLMEYNWPGNVRELENIVERAIILNPSGPLTFDYMNEPHKNEMAEVPGREPESLTLDGVISDHIRNVLSKTGGKVHGKDGAAELLGINASTLRNRMDKLGIEYGKTKGM